MGLKAGAPQPPKRVTDVGFVFSPLDGRFQRGAISDKRDSALTTWQIQNESL
jgi:hypothetical protein